MLATKILAGVACSRREPPWFLIPSYMSAEVRNMGTAGPTKSTGDLQMLFQKIEKILMKFFLNGAEL